MSREALKIAPKMHHFFSGPSTRALSLDPPLGAYHNMCVGGQVVLCVVATYSIRSCSSHFAAKAIVVRHYIAPVRAYNLLVCFEHVQNKRSGSAIKVVHVEPLPTLCRSWLVVTVSNSSPIRSQRPYVAFSRDFPFLWSHGERSGSYPLVWQGG